MEEMLVLSRKVGQKIAIGDDIVLVINRVAGNRVSIGIEAPDDIRIIRGELSLADDLAPDQRDPETRISPGSKAVSVA